jgi:hypothetical protein
MHHDATEQELTRIERDASAAAVPQLVSTIRAQQHDLDALRLGLDVATRDREELRAALLHAQAELRELRTEVARLRGGAASGD